MKMLDRRMGGKSEFLREAYWNNGCNIWKECL